MDEDGFTIWDSHAIIVYLLSKYAKDNKLYPSDIRQQAVVNQRLHFDSGILFPRLRRTAVINISSTFTNLLISISRNLSYFGEKPL